MPEAKVEHKKTWQTLFIFLTLVTLISAVFHYAIIALYPSRIYVGALMWSPAVAAILTLKLTGRPIASLPWNWGHWKYIRLSYWVPALYVLLTYLLIWLFHLGGLANTQMILEWAEEIGLVGIGTLSPVVSIIVAVVLMGTVGVIRAMATTLGEEIGWRGFFIEELRKVISFTGVSFVSGTVWAFWHFPLIAAYGTNIPLEMAAFFVTIVSMSFMMTYYTFKSNSLWPAVIFHAVSNVYVQKIFPPLTSEMEGTQHWLGEYGMMFALVTFLFGLYYWRKGKKEGL